MFKKIGQRSDLMKKNTKFIWIYGAILFSFALILILFAGLTQNNYQKEITKEQKVTAGVRQSLSSLSKENESLKKDYANLKKENESLKEANTQLALEKESAIVAYGGDVEVTRVLINAYMEKNAQRTDEAREMVKPLNVYKMTQAQRQLYNMIMGE